MDLGGFVQGGGTVTAVEQLRRDLPKLEQAIEATKQNVDYLRSMHQSSQSAQAQLLTLELYRDISRVLLELDVRISSMETDGK
jgi:biopolymer transport protein ExbB/TolQ